MASFVQEVLLASGKLNEKEDFNAKACRLKNKVDDLKSSLREKIESRYEVSSSVVLPGFTFSKVLQPQVSNCRTCTAIHFGTKNRP